MSVVDEVKKIHINTVTAVTLFFFLCSSAGIVNDVSL